jgi:hypothetical protein
MEAGFNLDVRMHWLLGGQGIEPMKMAALLANGRWVTSRTQELTSAQILDLIVAGCRVKQYLCEGRSRRPVMGNFSIVLSVLQANSVALNAIGNNLANLNTTGGASNVIFPSL